MAKRNNKPEQATNGGAGNESTATQLDESTAATNDGGATTTVDETTDANQPVDESTSHNVVANKMAELQDVITEDNQYRGIGVVLSTKELVEQAFTAHPHISKVWVDELKGEWHLVKRHGLKEFNRP